MRHSKKQRAAFLRWQKRRIKKIMSEISNTSGEGLANSTGSATDLNGGNIFWNGTNTNENACKSIESVFIKTDSEDLNQVQIETVNSEDLTYNGMHTSNIKTFVQNGEQKFCETNFVGKVESITSGTSIVMKIKRETPNTVLPKVCKRSNGEISNIDCPPVYVNIKTETSDCADSDILEIVESNDSEDPLLVELETVNYNSDLHKIETNNSPNAGNIKLEVHESTSLENDNPFLVLTSKSHDSTETLETVLDKVETKSSKVENLNNVERNSKDQLNLEKVESKISDNFTFEKQGVADSILIKSEIKVRNVSSLRKVEIPVSKPSNLDKIESKVSNNLNGEVVSLDKVGNKEVLDVVGKDHQVLDITDHKELDLLENVEMKDAETSESSKTHAKEEISVENIVISHETKKTTMQASTSGLNPLPEDESDENLSLDLHVSESENEDACKTDDIPMEIEEEILNKFDGNSLNADDLKKNNKEKKTENTKTNVIVEVANNILEKCDFKRNSPENASKDENKREPKTSSSVEDTRREETENEDLLLVMDEKTTYADENDYIDPEDDTNDKTSDEQTQSLDNESTPVESTSSTNDNTTEKDSDETDASSPDDTETATEDLQRETNNDEDDTNCQDDLPNDDFDTMEIEENEIQGNVDSSKTAGKDDQKEDGEGGKKDCEAEENRAIENVLDENKENVTEGGDNLRSVLKSLLTAGGKYVKGQKSQEGEKLTKSTKRQLNDQKEEEAAKRQKLIPESKPTTTITKLGSFKEFMLDKTLKGLTRDQLEVLCIQKMCESIRQKSEIGELKVKIKSQQQILESLRKEAVAIGKQTRDLGIVFDKINQDVANLADKPDKPLNIPKITRSVGLQAVVKDDVRRKSKGPTSPIVKAKTPRIAPANNSQIIPQPPSPRYTSPQKNIVTKKVKSPILNRPLPSKKNDNKGVIDLTDDDDRRAPSSKAQNGTKINMINAPNGHKFVVMPNGQTVMVKLATPNIVVTQSLRPVQLPVKTRQSNNFSQQNTYSPSNRQTSPKIVKHPAPLPASPPCSSDISRNAPPPKPQLMLNKTACGTGIILSWKMPYNLDLFEEIASYQLFAYQETKSDPKTDTWGKIGDVKALELPMAVTLTQFAVGNRYYFAVRAVDVLKRYGPFSEYQTILL